ncbi:MAG: hypothetical protein AAF226_12950, partial [Verrucomicrobiota bacterium]
FSLLNEFLQQLSPEVVGHSDSPLTAEDQALISQFAQGELSESDREKLMPRILENEKALRNLVDAIQSRKR